MVWSTGLPWGWVKRTPFSQGICSTIQGFDRFGRWKMGRQTVTLNKADNGSGARVPTKPRDAAEHQSRCFHRSSASAPIADLWDGPRAVITRQIVDAHGGCVRVESE